MRDPNPPKKVNTCAFCGPGITHIINPINYPNDIQASPDNLGRWKCGNCIEKELHDRIIKVTPNSDRAKEIIAEAKSKEQKDRACKQREADIRKFVRR
jgi:hypothetical protein